MKRYSNQEINFDFLSFVRSIKRNTLLSVIPFILTVLLIGSVSMIKTDTNAIRVICIAIQLCFFLCAGLLYSYYWPVKQNLRLMTEGKKLNDAFIITGLIIITLLIYYSLIERNLINAISSASSFLLPFLMIESWNIDSEIPAKEYKSLRFNSLPERAPVMSTKHSLPVQFRLTRKYYGVEESHFDAMVSGRMRLGTVFQHFIKTENIKGAGEAIEFIDPHGEPVKWRFYKKIIGGIFKQYLDHDINLIQNDVRTYTIINIERV